MKNWHLQKTLRMSTWDFLSLSPTNWTYFLAWRCLLMIFWACLLLTGHIFSYAFSIVWTVSCFKQKWKNWHLLSTNYKRLAYTAQIDLAVPTLLFFLSVSYLRQTTAHLHNLLLEAHSSSTWQSCFESQKTLRMSTYDLLNLSPTIWTD